MLSVTARSASHSTQWLHSIPILLASLAACAQAPPNGNLVPTLEVSTAVTPDGTALRTGDSCYTMFSTTGGKHPIGVTFQSIQPVKAGSVDALAVVVHQHMSDGKFDMRDAFLLRRKDMLPISFENTRFGKPHVHLEYGERKVDGWKLAKDGHKDEVHLTFATPVWEGNLWGVTFAALPLRQGESYRLPIYQYDSGPDEFLVDVKAPGTSPGTHGPEPQWELRAGTAAFRADYRVSGGPTRMEQSYVAGTQTQEPGGDCTGVQ